MIRTLFHIKNHSAPRFLACRFIVRPRIKHIVVIAVLVILSTAVSAQNISGSWNGELKAGFQKIPIVLNLISDGKCTLDSPSQGAKGISADVEFLSADSVSIRVPMIGATYSGRLKNGEIKGLFVQNGFRLPLTLTPGKTAELKRPQTPKPPYPYLTEEVSFTNSKAGATFSGTLTLPKNARCVLLMITGSGAQNRDEEVFGHKPFAVIADRLAREGIATLRYDDRATAKSVGGNIEDATTRDFADDAAAGVEWLRKSGRFKKIGVLGHSEGAIIGFMLGAQNKVDFVVSLAGTAVKGDSILLAQNKAIAGDAAKDLTIEQLRKMLGERQNPWMQWFVDYNPQTDIENVKCPVFAAFGSKDCQVAASQNLAAMCRALPNGKHNLLKEYDGLNHLFQHCHTGLPDEYGQIEETFSEEVIADMAQWIKSVW